MAYQLTQDCIDMDVEMSASAHSVLVVLCRHANDAGECFPATALIAKKAHLNPRTVMQAVKELEQGAWISSTQAPGKRRRFLIDVAKIQSFVPSEGNSAPAESYTTEESYTPAENCTTVKRCRPPLQEVTGDPCKKVQGTT
ncbi:helix-turn-helix domain-containing protein, partial [Duodenibacillus massiliensis]|uniref:helix-turn-helix domain-containing protein n=1 Tax=Duodenibacillus massiliensis TaxID=1852381 RepID=UPI003AF84972